MGELMTILAFGTLAVSACLHIPGVTEKLKDDPAQKIQSVRNQ